jgi:hypothetical protein
MYCKETINLNKDDYYLNKTKIVFLNGKIGDYTCEDCGNQHYSNLGSGAISIIKSTTHYVHLNKELDSIYSLEHKDKVRLINANYPQSKLEELIETTINVNDIDDIDLFTKCLEESMQLVL